MDFLRIAICDDQPLFLLGLMEVLQENELYEGMKTQVVGIASNDDELLPMLKEWRADILLLGINTATAKGIETLQKIQKEKLEVKTIVLTMHNNLSLEDQYIKKGARACVYKMTEIEPLLQTIKKVFNGTIKTTGNATTPNLANRMLTERETEILKWARAGLTSKQTGEKLNISTNTVRNHRQHILEKTESTTLTEAATKVLGEN
jgi:two-component system, NarL family, response regulator DegU